jgi:proteasome lid subunit RPN8/RPN11
MSPIPLLTIPLAAWQAVREEAVRWTPEEACGLLAGQPSGLVERAIPVTNRLHSPSRFEMEPQEQLRAFLEIEAAGLVLLAIYHSHPLGPSHPSPTDQAEFAYPGVAYLIWTPDQPIPPQMWNARCFSMDGGLIQETSFRVI